MGEVDVADQDFDLKFGCAWLARSSVCLDGFQGVSGTPSAGASDLTLRNKFCQVKKTLCLIL